MLLTLFMLKISRKDQTLMLQCMWAYVLSIKSISSDKCTRDIIQTVENKNLH